MTDAPNRLPSLDAQRAALTDWTVARNLVVQIAAELDALECISAECRAELRAALKTERVYRQKFEALFSGEG